MSKNVLGIDIAKLDLSVCLIGGETRHHGKFFNDKQGHNELFKWVKSFKLSEVEVYLESTGKYGNQVCDFFYQQGLAVKVINPFQIKSFARTKLVRHKTDKVDAAIIAEYGMTFSALSYQPLSSTKVALRALYRHSITLKEQIVFCGNQLEKQELLQEDVAKSWLSIRKQYQHELETTMAKINKIIAADPVLQQHCTLLQTVKGVGAITAIACLAELPDLKRFKSARDLAAYAGLTPRHFQSGGSVRGKSRISKMGNRTLRKALYLPAMSAMRSCSVFASLKQKMSKAGKKPKMIICAIMRRMLHVIYGILKHQTVFSEEKLQHPSGA